MRAPFSTLSACRHLKPGASQSIMLDVAQFGKDLGADWERAMPIYEYRCKKCHRRTSLLLRRLSDAQSAKPICPHCGHNDLDRLISRVATLKSEDARLDAPADSAALGDLDENDPRSVARYMKKLSGEVGEFPLGYLNLTAGVGAAIA